MRDVSDLESIPSTGLTVLMEPDEPHLDIVFVHGFTGHPMRTWNQNNGDSRLQADKTDEPNERPSKHRRLNPFVKPTPNHGGSTNRGNEYNEAVVSSSSTQSVPLARSAKLEARTCTYWPTDCLPTIVPDARILTHGYDTHIRHKLGPIGNQNSVYDIAWNFLVALEAVRRDCPLRPLIFIVHSLGGIIVKETLRRSNSVPQNQRHLRTVFTSTIGIMFFGTPHGGADPGHFVRRVAERIVRASGFTFNDTIIDTLLPSSDRLRQLRDEFVPLAVEQNWIIHSFQEQKAVAGLGGDKVVEDVSSYLNQPTIEVTEHIGRNHMDICRFMGLNDVEFRKVTAALQRMTVSTLALPSALSQEPKALNEEQAKKLLESLKFDQIDARLLTIKHAHARTCAWLLKTPQYLSWTDKSQLSQHHGFLWIKGKPGAGKSTLMKYALTNARKSKKDKLVSFFFNARGDDLEKSIIGTYQSLLLQILDHFPSLKISVFESLGLSASSIDIDRQWSIQTLETLLEQAIRGFGNSSVVCFIDALDECEEAQVRDMISFFERIGDITIEMGISFRVCFSSRYYPYITIRHSVDLDLEGQEGHDQDIINYLDSALKIGSSELASHLRQEIQEKSSGIFMWVILVVQILNKEHDSGRPPTLLRRRLQQIPGDLGELFRSIITRDSSNKEELICCLQWVLFAKQPLKPEQLYFAIIAESEHTALSKWDSREVRMGDIERFILNASKGLAEITKSKKPTVQFIHETVKSFLLEQNGLGSIWPEYNTNFIGQSHDHLKLCCANHLHSDIREFLDFSTQHSELSDKVIAARRRKCMKSFPFLEYAVRNVLYHADVAQGLGLPQAQFLEQFSLSGWIRISNFLERHKVRKHTDSVSLLYIFAECNLPNLIKACSSPATVYLQHGYERYGSPLFASLATDSEAATRAMLQVHASNAPSGSRLLDLCSRYGLKEGEKKLTRRFNFSQDRTVLSYLAELGNEILFAFMLETGNFLPDGPDADGRTPLLRAVENGNKNIVKLLLDIHKVNFGIMKQMVQTPQDIADALVKQPIVKWSLKGSLDLDFTWTHLPTPLHAAIWRGEEDIVKLFLEQPNLEFVLEGATDSLLGLAVLRGKPVILKLLLDAGVLNVNDTYGGEVTLFDLAVRHRSASMVKLLLQTGRIDINSTHRQGEPALHWAAGYGHDGVVDLLISQTTIDINATNRQGETALHIASRSGRQSLVKLLIITDGVDLDKSDIWRYTPLSIAAYLGHDDIVRLLLDTHKVNVNVENTEGKSPLYLAVEHNFLSTTICLLSAEGVDVGKKDKFGISPLSKAVQKRARHIIKAILDYGDIDVNSEDRYGSTPLHFAAEAGDLSLFELLVKTGKADMDCMNARDQTPQDVATIFGNDAIVEYLRARR